MVLHRDGGCLEPTFGYRHYYSPEWHSQEVHALTRYPVLLAHEEEVATRGRFARINVLGENLILVNDGAKVRAFLNICPHRGALLCTKAHGQIQEFRCGYHGAAFSLEGLGSSFADPKEPMNMVEIPTVRSGPWIFAVLNPEGPVTPPPLPAAMLNLPKLKLEGKRGYFSHAVNINWKYFIENTLETLHVTPIHPGLSQILGPEIRWQFHGAYAQMQAPIASRIAGVSSESMYVQHMQSLNPGAEWQYYFIFPSTHVTVFPEQVHFLSVTPLSERKSMIRGYYLYRPQESRTEKLLRYLNWRISLRVWHEDYSVFKLLENSSGPLSDKMNLSLHPRHEEVISYFQSKLAGLVETHPA